MDPLDDIYLASLIERKARRHDPDQFDWVAFWLGVIALIGFLWVVCGTTRHWIEMDRSINAAESRISGVIQERSEQ